MALSTKDQRELAESAWVLALDHCKAHGTAYRHHGRDGYRATVKGGVSGFIRKAAKDLDIKIDKPQIDETRALLRGGQNVVYVGGGKPGYSDVFAASEWSEVMGVTEKVIVTKAFRGRETGQLPGGESSEVTTSNLFEEFASAPIGPRMAETLEVIAKHGGKLEYSQIYRQDKGEGNINSLFESSHIPYLERRGLIIAKRRNERRYECIKFTPKGWLAASNIGYIQSAEVALETFLQRYRSFTKSPGTSSVVSDLAPLVHRSESAVSSAIRKMEEDGTITVDRGEAGVYPRSVALVSAVEPETTVAEMDHAQEMLRDQVDKMVEFQRELEQVHPATAYEDLVYTSDAEVEDARRRHQPQGAESEIQMAVDLLYRAIGNLRRQAPKPDLRIEKVQKVCEDVEKGERTLLDAINEISRIVG